MRDTHRKQNIESLSSSWITQLCPRTAPGGWRAAEPGSGSWQRRNKKWQEGRVLPKEKVVVLIILPFFFVGVFATKDLKIVNKKRTLETQGRIGRMMVLPLQRGGPTSSAATGDDSGMMMSQVYAEFFITVKAWSFIIRPCASCTHKKCILRHPDAQFRRSCEEITPGVSISWSS